MDAELVVRGRQTSLKPVATPLAEARVEPCFRQFIDSVTSTGTRVSVIELAGNPVAAVIDYAKRTAADLIVVAKHGRPYGSYWRPGAYATDLARTASRPTPALPETQEANPNAKAPHIEILCATDFSSASRTKQIADPLCDRVEEMHQLGSEKVPPRDRYRATDVLSMNLGW